MKIEIAKSIISQNITFFELDEDSKKFVSDIAKQIPVTTETIAEVFKHECGLSKEELIKKLKNCGYEIRSE